MKLSPGTRAEGPAAHGHGVRVVEEDRLGAELAHVLRDLQQGRDVALGPEDAARSHGVPDAVVHPVPHRDLVVVPERLHPAHLDHGDHVVGAPEGLAPVGGGSDPRVHLVVRDHPLHEGLHLVEPLVAEGHEPELAPREGGRRQEVAHQGLAEHQAARANHRDLRHFSLPLLALWPKTPTVRPALPPAARRSSPIHESRCPPWSSCPPARRPRPTPAPPGWPG